MNSIHADLAQTFPWLTPAECDSVAEHVRQQDRPDLSARERMRRLVCSLDDFGLRLSSTRLLQILGAGSKSDAVNVMQIFARERFDRAVQEKTHIGNAEARPQTQEHASIDQFQEILRQAVAGVSAPARTETDLHQLQQQLAGLSGLVNHMAGDLRWLKSTIDTERQLRRYQETYGDLAETPRAPETSRRQVVNQLTGTLQASYVKAQTQAPAGVNRADAADSAISE